MLPFRIGHGFDLHRLEHGDYRLILGGVDIPHDRGCVAHSDGAHNRHEPTYDARRNALDFMCGAGDALLHTITGELKGFVVIWRNAKLLCSLSHRPMQMPF